VLNIEFPYNTTISNLGVFPGELKTYLHVKSSSEIFLAALFK
jgi:hypothetical protein